MRAPTDKAVSIGVIVTELTTNAYKYAYKQHMRGDIRVRMVRDGEYRILSVEDGKRSPDIPARIRLARAGSARW